MTDDDTPLPQLGLSLDEIEAHELAGLISEVDARDIAYPFGSGQGDELALRAGLRPMIRELLDDREIDLALQRYERAGFIHEIAERRYGPTHDGWDDTPDPSQLEPSRLRRALFIGRDRQRLRDAVACDLAKTDEADHELGRLLGYPKCCVESFVASSSQRKNTSLIERTLRATDGAPLARLNVLDLSVFHLISWYPCSFRCVWSARYANALADRITRIAPAFMRAIDEALARSRLVLHDEVQLSLTGVDHDHWFQIEHVRPTSRDRHPSVVLDEGPRRAVTRALHTLRHARKLAVDDGALSIDDIAIELTGRVMLARFVSSLIHVATSSPFTNGTSSVSPCSITYARRISPPQTRASSHRDA